MVVLLNASPETKNKDEAARHENGDRAIAKHLPVKPKLWRIAMLACL